MDILSLTEASDTVHDNILYGQIPLSENPLAYLFIIYYLFIIKCYSRLANSDKIICAHAVSEFQFQRFSILRIPEIIAIIFCCLPS